MEFSGNYSHEKLVERAMRSAHPRRVGGGTVERWVAVRDTFATGSTMAVELCRAFGLDPHEQVSSARCVTCDP